MNERKWLSGTDSTELLQFLRASGTPSERKYRLYAIAVARRGCHLLDEENVQSLETIERFADGLATDAELQAACRELLGHGVDEWQGRFEARSSAGYAGHHDIVSGAGHAQTWAVDVARARIETAHPDLDFDVITAMAEQAERPFQCNLLRDIFGNPFRLVAFDPAWRTDTAVSLARLMYESREFSAMPILADALQDAGCDNPDVLNHCRGEGPHVRGCWVVDLVLGKM